jgi:hypothetical protein
MTERKYLTELEAWREIRGNLQWRRNYWYGGLCWEIDKLRDRVDRGYLGITLSTRRKMHRALMEEAVRLKLGLRAPCYDYIWPAASYQPRIRFVNKQIRRLS